MAGWDTFAMVSGGAAGALIGLLFVAVSIRIDVISASVDFSSRAAQTLTLFATVLLVALALAIPAQPEWTLGAELLAIATAIGTVLVVLERRAQANSTMGRVSELLGAVEANASTSLILVVAGLLLVGVGR